MMDFVLRQAGEPVAYPSSCLLCTSDVFPLIDTFGDTHGGMRVYLCLRCAGKVAAAIKVAPMADFVRVQNDLAGVAELEGQLEEARSERPGFVSTIAELRDENRQLHANGGRTDGELVSALAANAVRGGVAVADRPTKQPLKPPSTRRER
jgi:hypothetical protein